MRMPNAVRRLRNMYGKKFGILREIGCVCYDSPFTKIQHVATLRLTRVISEGNALSLEIILLKKLS